MLTKAEKGEEVLKKRQVSQRETSFICSVEVPRQAHKFHRCQPLES